MQTLLKFNSSAMEALPTVTPASLIRSHFYSKPIFNLSFTHKRSILPNLTRFPNSRFTHFTAISQSVSTEDHQTENENHDQDDKFDWFSNWYPLMPVCDLDKKAPHGKKVLGLDVVVWWDGNENEWKVFDDRCPHRLAPLSEGRIDQWGRLQCVYHGWCFGGSGHCKLIPQAPLDGPPVHSFPKARVAVYPTTVRNEIVWFWPNSDPEYKDIITKKKPPYIPEIDDPSYVVHMFNRDIPYGYEVLIENLMDPSHVPYAHHGIMRIGPEPSVKLDREGGMPIDINIKKFDKYGFTAVQQGLVWNFVSPCYIQGIRTFKESTNNKEGKSTQKPPRRDLFIFFCVPVRPGNSRVIVVSARNYGIWMDPFVTRWMHHITQNLVFDSDLYLLRVEEEKLMEVGPSNWQKACLVATKADANVVAYRKWLKKYAGGQVDWGTRLNGSLPQIPPRKLLMDRYWSHVVNCSCCNGAYTGLKAIQFSLQVFSVASLAILPATKSGMIPVVAKNTLAITAIMCFVGSKWLSHFIYKNFHFHDYNHAFK